MASRRKKVVENFYKSDVYKNPDLLAKYLHPEAVLYWNSSSGFHKLDYDGIFKMLKEISKSFHSLRAEISHLIRKKDMVTIRFTYFVKTIENPREEMPMAHFMAIWEIKDEKMYKGHQMSQPADDSPENLSSFLSI